MPGSTHCAVVAESAGADRASGQATDDRSGFGRVRAQTLGDRRIGVWPGPFTEIITPPGIRRS